MDPSGLPAYELSALRDELTRLALQVAANFGIELDYSPESVKKVEEILAILHDEYARTGNDEGMNGIAMEFAAYIVTVIESNFDPGAWSRAHPQLGADSFPYHWRGEDLFPVAWCQKRIFDGPADDVWAKFDSLVLGAAESDESPPA